MNIVGHGWVTLGAWKAIEAAFGKAKPEYWTVSVGDGPVVHTVEVTTLQRRDTVDVKIMATVANSCTLSFLPHVNMEDDSEVGPVELTAYHADDHFNVSAEFGYLQWRRTS